MHLRVFVAFTILVSSVLAGAPSSDGAVVDVTESAAETWSLTMDQRRAYLEYYAPVIFKKASENGGADGPDARAGRGWMTNFDFDNDQTFSNNKENWESLATYMDGEQPDWDIGPTIYTAVLEYSTEDGKFATLLYHPYFAKQRGSIHDWERIEIRLSNITGDPGSGETVDYAVITEHGKHNTRPGGHEDLNFMPTENGMHPMIWRAEQISPQSIFNPDRPYNGELHYVEESWPEVRSLAGDPDRTARVDINGHGRKGYHYVFVPAADREAVLFWNAPELSARTASALASRRGTSSVDVDQTKRIRYELQDLADILPTHWAGGSAARHWTSASRRDILIEDALPGGLDGGPGVPVGRQTFHARSIDSEDPDEGRSGYATKHWFWGAYLLGCDGNFGSAAFADGAPNGTRMVANGDPASVGAYFHQHDYFAHSGQRSECDTTGDLEKGMWLPDGWHLDANGGFDGRWVPLFDNDA